MCWVEVLLRDGCECNLYGITWVYKEVINNNEILKNWLTKYTYDKGIDARSLVQISAALGTWGEM